LIATAAARLGRQLPPLENITREPYQFHLGRSRRPFFIVVVLTAMVMIGVPIAGLVWRTGLSGVPSTWSLATFERYLFRAIHSHGWIILESLGAAGIAGLITAFLALLTCWLATESRRFQWVCLTLLAAAWALPGPVIGFGLKDTIEGMLDSIGSASSGRNLVAEVLWYGPSPAPIVWIYM